MKNIILLLATVFLAIAANAQKIKEADVPAVVKNSFSKMYASAKVELWEKENGNYEAAFDYQNNEMSVLIDANGIITETETEIQVNELSKTITDYCAANYAGAKLKEAAKIVDSKGEITFEVEIKKMDVLFDSNGKFLKEMKD